jgi:hypothetical protein
MALLASHVDPSKPVLSIDVPAKAWPALASGGSEIPWLEPGDQPLPPQSSAGGVRISLEQRISDSHLLVPISGPSLQRLESRQPMTWLIHVDEWKDEHLALGIETVALQRMADRDMLAFIGPSSNSRLALARARFPGRAAAFRRIEDAVRRLETPLVAYLGGGVLLHDSRLAELFSSALSEAHVATVSCVIVSAEKKSGVVRTAIVDGGAFIRSDGQSATHSDCTAAAAQLWRQNYSVLAPSSHLWATRSALLSEWCDEAIQQLAGPQVHLCSSAVTASYLKRRSSALPVSVPKAPETATKIRWLIG